MYNDEPTLKGIEDYNTLKGQKKRIVLAVIISGLIMGAIILTAKTFLQQPEDAIEVEQSIGTIPVQ